jgi:putative transposase
MRTLPHDQSCSLRRDSIDRNEFPSGLFKRLDRLYALIQNKKRGWCGHSWQQHFFSSPLDESALLPVARYVELNPVRAGLVKKVQDNSWSSARAHCAGSTDAMLSHAGVWHNLLSNAIKDWSQWLGAGLNEQESTQMRACLLRGLPYGSDKFISALETRARRPLRLRPPGRPLRTKK